MKFCRRVKGPEEKEDFLKISKTIKGFPGLAYWLKEGNILGFRNGTQAPNACAWRIVS